MKIKLRRILLMCSVMVAGVGCAASGDKPVAVQDKPARLVVWISVDGLRADYLDRAKAPFLKSMIKTGAYSRAMVPPYPSLTFASHISEVTGASPAKHGIPGNSFYDRNLGLEFNFPARPDLLKAETLWTAATRQGQRVAVFDWPFSMGQTGNFATAYFNDQFDAKQTDDDRMSKLTSALRYDEGLRGSGVEVKQLSLVMGYVESVDKAGHAMGPSSTAVIEQVERMDGLLREVYEQAVEALGKKYPAGSKLYFVVSTDHGMSEVKYAVNLKLFLADVLPPGAKVITGGGTGHVFLPESEKKAEQLAVIREKLKSLTYARVFDKTSLPSHWSMYDADRIGDLYIDLPSGYTFNSRGKEVLVNLKTETTTRPYDRAPKGMHSYDPATTPEMLGFIAFSRFPNDFGGKDLGTVDARQLAPTVAGFLEISPPKDCEVKALPLK